MWRVRNVSSMGAKLPSWFMCCSEFYGPRQGSSCYHLAQANFCEGAATLSGICQLLLTFYSRFQYQCGTSNRCAKREPKMIHLAAEEAFTHLKMTFTAVPVLKHPDSL